MNAAALGRGTVGALGSKTLWVNLALAVVAAVAKQLQVELSAEDYAVVGLVVNVLLRAVTTGSLASKYPAVVAFLKRLAAVQGSSGGRS